MLLWVSPGYYYPAVWRLDRAVACGLGAVGWYGRDTVGGKCVNVPFIAGVCRRQ